MTTSRAQHTPRCSPPVTRHSPALCTLSVCAPFVLCLCSMLAPCLLAPCSLHVRSLSASRGRSPCVHTSPAGSWHHLDLSHNSLGPGSAMMLCEVIRHLGLSAASYITPRTYARHWLARGDGATPDGRASAQPTDTRSPSPSRTQHSSHGDGDGGDDGGARPRGRASCAAPAAAHSRGSGGAFGGGGSAPGSHGKPKAPRAHMTLGSQLAVAPVEIVIDGNPLGLSGMR